MFCPICGNNCGDNRFCGRCGTQVQETAVQEPQQPAWSVGMPCPHCGGTKLEGNHCAFCGSQLLEDVDNRQYSQIPLGNYEGSGVGGAITLTEKSFVIHWWIFFRKLAHKQEIRYDQIEHVRFIRAQENKSGFLAVRWTGNRDIPFPSNQKGYLCDRTTVTFIQKDNEDFYKVFCYLKTKAPEGAQFSIYNSV